VQYQYPFSYTLNYIRKNFIPCFESNLISILNILYLDGSDSIQFTQKGDHFFFTSSSSKFLRKRSFAVHLQEMKYGYGTFGSICPFK
jgi:hypothetical protein